jgi:hypothetical protein
VSLHRKNPKRDANELDIIKGLADLQVHVFQLSGSGLPDLLVSLDGLLALIEVKNGTAGRLTPAQQQFWTNYVETEQVPAYICREVQELPEILESVRTWYAARA